MSRRRSESQRKPLFGPALAAGALTVAACSASEPDSTASDRLEADRVAAVAATDSTPTSGPADAADSPTSDLVIEVGSDSQAGASNTESQADETSTTTDPSGASSTASTTTAPPTDSTATTASTTSSSAHTTTSTTAAPTTTTSPTTAPTTTRAPDPGRPFIAVDFQSSPLGPYDSNRIRSEWPGVRYANTGGPNTIMEEAGNRFLRVEFPRGNVGHSEAGTLWKIDLNDNSADELYVAYRVRFGPGFDFVRGGKLPGLSGGEDNTGGNVPNGNDGWSARMMWRGEGDAVQYVYHPDQPTQWGEDLDWGRRFTPDRWVTVETRVRMNTPGQRDGVIEAWMDGTRTVSRTNLRFRDTSSFGIDSFLFHTFFGGSGADWAPSKNERIDFDDVVISTGPITH